MAKLKIQDLIPDAANARVHTDKNKQALAASLKRFGPARSIVLDSKNVVRAGNGTLEAAQAAGVENVRIVDAKPGELIAVRRSDWSASEATAYAIADNRTAELAEWDYDVLSRTLENLDPGDLASTGFSPDDVEAFVGAEGWFDPDAGEGLDNKTREDQPTRLTIVVEDSGAVDDVRSAVADVLEKFPAAKML